MSADKSSYKDNMFNNSFPIFADLIFVRYSKSYYNFNIDFTIVLELGHDTSICL